MNNKEKIISNAMELFHRKGYTGTSLEDILQTSGVCKSNFYYHFKSKEALAAEVLQRKIDEIDRAVIEPALFMTSGAVLDRIEALFRYTAQYCGSSSFDRGCFFGQLVLELESSEEPLFRASIAYFSQLEQQLGKLIGEGIDREEFTLVDMTPEELAVSMVALLQGAMVLSKGFKSDRAILHSLKLMVSVFSVQKTAM